MDIIETCIQYAEEEFKKGTIKNYKYDRISNTLSVQLFPVMESCEINIKITSKELQNG
jgi:hypothetical protein